MEDVISFLRENSLAVLVEVHRKKGVIRTEKLEELVEPYLFRQLIEDTDGKGLYQVGGGHFPFQMFNQGETWCVLSRFVPNRVIAMFYNSGEDTLTNYHRAQELDEKVRVFYGEEPQPL
ncbi:MAG: hypothetical protein HDT43_07560 [Ruminococcaceae bacterium]|nr:hypothetical protein [Oscillospiraceae bacterium]